MPRQVPDTASPSLARRALPFLLAAVLLAYVLSRLDLDRFAAAIASTHYVLFFVFTLAFTLTLLAADSFATSKIYARTVHPIRFRELFVIRGASYLPSLLNHHVGQGWLTYYVSRAYGAPLWRVAGATLLVYATTFACLLLIGTVALVLNPDKVAWLGTTILAVAAAGAVYAVVVVVGPQFLRRRQALAPLFELGLAGQIVQVAYRLPHIVVLFVGTLVPFWFFGVWVPLDKALVYIPILMLIAALPITPQGVGTRDVVALELLAPFAPGTPAEQTAAVVAATLSFACALTIVQALVSTLMLRQARQLFAAREASPRSEEAPTSC